MSAERRVRIMTYDDIAAVAAIEKNLFPQPWSATIFSVQLQREDGIYLVCDIAGEIVGYLIADIFVDVWHIMNIAVDELHRRKNIASELLESYFSITEQEPHRGHTLEVRVSNEAAVDLYRSFGFISSGVRPNYYSDNSEDALIMWRDWEGDSA